MPSLEDLGIANNTYVIYTADHETPGRNGPLQGGNGGLWDGGIRIPLFVRGPEVKAGSHSPALVTGADLFPTIADLAGVKDKLADEVEGESLSAYSSTMNSSCSITSPASAWAIPIQSFEANQGDQLRHRARHHLQET